MPLSAAGKSKDPSILVFPCGENHVRDISMFSPGVDEKVSKTLVVSCFLIRNGDDFFMWETGLSDSLFKEKDGLSVRDGAFTLKVKKPLAQQFKELNIDPTKVNLMAFSHMHPDHTGNAKLFSHAKILIQKKEFEAALGPKAIDFSFNPETYPKDRKRYQIIADDHDVFGDGSVKIISTPGHTPGHQSLVVNLKERGTVLISGDLYHFNKNRQFKRVPAFNFNKEQTLSSMKKFESLVTKLKAEVWISHDPGMEELYLIKQFFR